MPFVRSSEAASGTVTMSLTPSKVRAEPYLPAAVQVAPAIVPWLADPERSVRVVPAASSNPYAATRPTAPFETVTLTGADVVVLPAGSRETAVSECGPFVAV